MTKAQLKFKPASKSTPKCCAFCRRQPVYSVYSNHCFTCHHMLVRMARRRVPRKSIKAIRTYVRKHGWVCYYTKMELEMSDPNSPWYCVFDHWVPRDGRKVVITSALFNEMKTDLSEKEFWRIVIMLANFKRYHMKVRKIKLRYWSREHLFSLDTLALAINHLSGYRQCLVCGKQIRFAYAHTQYCPICALLLRRVSMEGYSRQARVELCDYIRKNGHKCALTGMPLDVKNPKGPWYCALSRWIPGDYGKVLLTSMVLSDMRSDLTVEEFWYFICQLADHKEKGKSIRKIKLACWARPCKLDDVQ